MAEPVSIVRDGRLRAAGIRQGDVIGYDWGFEQDGELHRQRSFLLLDDGVAINQPVLFPAEQQGWWYCDLVRVIDEEHTVYVDDLWIDVIVGPATAPYRMLDLDEYGQAIEAGRLSQVEAVDGLVRLQRFLDRRLNRRHQVEPSWPAFPPPEVLDLMDAELPDDWHYLV